VPDGDVCQTPEAAKAIAEKLFAAGSKVVVIKAQIHAGGRGKGTFKNGFKGGVKLCKTSEEIYENANAPMLGNVLVTKQTGSDGRLVSKVLVSLAADDQKGTLPGGAPGPRIITPDYHGEHRGRDGHRGSGGQNPGKIVKETIDPATGLMPYQGRKLAVALGLKGDLINAGAKLLLGVYKTWWSATPRSSKSIRSALSSRPMARRRCSRRCEDEPG